MEEVLSRAWKIVNLFNFVTRNDIKLTIKDVSVAIFKLHHKNVFLYFSRTCEIPFLINAKGITCNIMGGL